MNSFEDVFIFWHFKFTDDVYRTKCKYIWSIYYLWHQLFYFNYLSSCMIVRKRYDMTKRLRKKARSICWFLSFQSRNKSNYTGYLPVKRARVDFTEMNINKCIWRLSVHCAGTSTTNDSKCTCYFFSFACEMMKCTSCVVRFRLCVWVCGCIC